MTYRDERAYPPGFSQTCIYIVPFSYLQHTYWQTRHTDSSINWMPKHTHSLIEVV